MVQLLNAVIVAQYWLWLTAKSAALVPLMVKLLMVTIMVPLLKRLMLVVTGEPSLVLPMSTFTGTLRPAPAGCPIPDRATDCGLPVALSLMVSVAVRMFAPPGVNTT